MFPCVPLERDGKYLVTFWNYSKNRSDNFTMKLEYDQDRVV